MYSLYLEPDKDSLLLIIELTAVTLSLSYAGKEYP